MDAVYVAQRNKATASAVHYDVNSDCSIIYNSVSFGDPSGTGGPVSLLNVAAGTAPTDAVNVEQLMDVRDHVLHRQQKYRDEANAGIAAAIAMEAAPYLPRSEEHTSELQSLMRTSYAVFCLKKTKHKHNNNIAQYNSPD